MREDLKKLLIEEKEMYAVNGLGDVLDALKEYRMGMTRSVDNCLKFLALMGALGMALIAAIGFAIAFSSTLSFPVLFPTMIALMAGGVLFGTRRIDFSGRYIHGKFGVEAHSRYRSYKHPGEMQKRLFSEVERYNKLVRAIHVSDEIDAAGVAGAKISDRQAVLHSMAIARTDLIRALKLERIMRENADVSNADFQLFNVDLTHLAAMQVEDAATQQGKLMNEAFQIARSVQIEVRKLQTHDHERA